MKYTYEVDLNLSEYDLSGVLRSRGDAGWIMLGQPVLSEGLWHIFWMKSPTVGAWYGKESEVKNV